jgi:cytoskeletal protein CcmA (bactofilin family)
MLFFSGSFWKGWDAMRSAMEIMAMATLGLIAMWLLRRRFRRATTFAVVMAAALCAVALPPPAAAADTEHGKPNYTLAAGQVVKTDLIVAADRTVIDGDVDGDLIAWSRNITVNGHVKGDILGWGQLVTVNGTVDGNVRAFCQTLAITGTVGKNAMAWCGDVNLDQKGKVGGSATLGAGDGELNGSIGGDVLAFIGTLQIDGPVGGNVRVGAGHLTIGSKASIAGTTKYEGANPAQVDPGAKLASPLEFIQHKRGPDRMSPRYYWHQALHWGASFVFGLVLLLLAPGFFYDVSNACKKVASTSGLGVLFLLATPVAAILVCITIIGIPVGIAALLLYAIAIYSAQVFVGTWLGNKILGAAVGFGPTLGRLALGLAIIRVVRLIPFLGVLVGSVVVIWGLGALVLTLYRYMRPQFVPAAA